MIIQPEPFMPMFQPYPFTMNLPRRSVTNSYATRMNTRRYHPITAPNRVGLLLEPFLNPTE